MPRVRRSLDLVIGFTVGLGLGSHMGQRTVPVILLIMLEIVITPALANHALPGFIDGQRLIVGVAMDQLKPAALARLPDRSRRRADRAGDTAHAHLGDDHRHRRLVAWKMITRDA